MENRNKHNKHWGRNRSWTLTHRGAVFQSEWPPFSSPGLCLRSKCCSGDVQWSTGSWGGCCCCSTRGAEGATLHPDLVRTPALLDQQRSYQWCSRYWSGGQDMICRRWHRAGCRIPNQSSSSSIFPIWYRTYLAQENGDLRIHLTTGMIHSGHAVDTNSCTLPCLSMGILCSGSSWNECNMKSPTTSTERKT